MDGGDDLMVGVNPPFLRLYSISLQYITRGGEEKKKKKKPIDSHYTRAQQERLRPPGVSVYIVYKVAGQPLTSSLFFLPSSSLSYTVSNWMLFGHCSSGVVLDYFVHIPPLFSIVQLLRFTIPLFFFSSLLFVPLHVACYVRRRRRRPARSPLGTNDPQTRDLSLLATVGGLFVRFSSAIVYTGVEHYTHWIADGQNSGEREREREGST